MAHTYEKLLREAIEVMNEHGYAGTSVQMIAEKASVSKSTVIHYFKNKEGILLAILGNFLPRLTKKFNNILNEQQLDGLEILRRFINFHVHVIEKSGDILALNIKEARYLKDKNRAIIENYQRDYEQLIVKIIEKIKAENYILENFDTVVIAKAIMGMCNSPTIWYKKDHGMGVMEIASHFFDLLVPGYNCLRIREDQRSDSYITASSL